MPLVSSTTYWCPFRWSRSPRATSFCRPYAFRSRRHRRLLLPELEPVLPHSLCRITFLHSSACPQCRLRRVKCIEVREDFPVFSSSADQVLAGIEDIAHGILAYTRVGEHGRFDVCSSSHRYQCLVMVYLVPCTFGNIRMSSVSLPTVSGTCRSTYLSGPLLHGD